MTRGVVDCPKARGALKGEMPNLRSAEVRWADECVAKMVAPGLEQLTWIRPRIHDLSSISHLISLTELDLWYARNFASLAGLAAVPSLAKLGLHSCPNLIDLNTVAHQMKGPRQVLISGCVRFVDATGVLALEGLERLCIYGGERSPNEVRLPRAITSRSVELELRGVTPTWI